MDALAVMAAFAISVGIGRGAMAAGPALGLVDLPDSEGLKTHRGAVVPLGGAGILLGLHVGLALAGLFDPGLLAGTVLMWLVGLFDDGRGLDPRLRLVAAALAGWALVVLGDRGGTWQLALAAMLLVVVAVNAVNLFDGLDGLAGSVTTVIAGALAVLGMTRSLSIAVAGMVLAAALLGFLLWNLPPARLFLGDNGAYVVGVTLAWLAIRISPDWGALAVSAALLGVPLIDLAVTVLRRMRAGAPLFGGDRDHSYDRLHARGLSVVAVDLVMVAAQISWAGVVIAVAVNFGDLAAVAVAIGLGLVVIVALGWSRRSPAPRR